jgi:hypothetical protein
MAKFDPNRVRPGTIEYVRDADGMYTTRVVGLESVNSLSLPEISDTAAVTKTDTDTKTATEITGDTIQSQTQQAFKTFDRDDSGPDTTGDMLKQATKLSRNLTDFNPDTASEQFARQTILPGTFDAEKFDETEDKVSIKDPTENVFGKSTPSKEQFQRQTTLPDLNVEQTKDMSKVPSRNDLNKGNLRQLNRTGRTTVNGVVYTRDEIDQATIDRGIKSAQDDSDPGEDNRTNLGISVDTTFGTGTATSTQAEQEAAAGTLGISADPTKSTFGTAVDRQQGFTDIDRFKGISQEGALAGEGEKQDVKPVKRNALKTLGNSITTALKDFKSPVMGFLEGITRPESNIQKLNKSYFTDRGDGRIGGNPATDLYAGMNRTSAFGNLEQAGDKRIARREQNIINKGYSKDYDPNGFWADTQKMKEQAKDYKRKKTETQRDTQGPAGQGGASGTDSGKIVCTMMNESYGFGSFRNKIWMKFHGNIAPEYQKGYHKLFLPLVKYAKQKGIVNKIIKNILEHIAVHSTIDMRQTLRGKRHTLGRLYRKIILPLCYWAGKK